jgi:hypothetical protein
LGLKVIQILSFNKPLPQVKHARIHGCHSATHWVVTGDVLGIDAYFLSSAHGKLATLSEHNTLVALACRYVYIEQISALFALLT